MKNDRCEKNPYSIFDSSSCQCFLAEDCRTPDEQKEFDDHKRKVNKALAEALEAKLSTGKFLFLIGLCKDSSLFDCAKTLPCWHGGDVNSVQLGKSRRLGTMSDESEILAPSYMFFALNHIINLH